MRLLNEILAVAPGAVAFDPERHERYRCDRSTWGQDAGAPLAIVGTLKREGLVRQLGPVSMALHTRVKRAFDPAWILNPGKVVREIKRKAAVRRERRPARSPRV